MSSPQRIITDTDKAPLVEVLSMMFLVISVLACFVRSGTKIHMVKALKIDDILAVAAAVFSIGQSIAVFIACEHGLGTPFSTLSSSKKETFFKSQYAANAMFIASLLCSKLSGTMGLRMMSRRGQERPLLVFEIIVGLWGLSAFVVSFFQCQLPRPWDYSDSTRCINFTSFWTYYSVANIVTDIAIVAIMTDNARRIQTSWSKRILVICVFGSRIFVVPAVAVQIYYSNKAFASDDLSFSLWEASITIQLVQCLAIFTVCVPNLKPFLDSLESGQIRIDDLRRQGKSSSNGYPTYRPGAHSGYKSAQHSGLGSRSRPHDTIDEPITTISQHSQHSNVHELVDMSKSTKRGVALTTDGQKKSWDSQSHQSHSSQTILVHQTWQVDVQSMHGSKVPREEI
ncbi:hypothetical protein BGZ61DRAFT_507586 [Ilyonectria robusta]|uniref:uncharacterized protein n=1 Tax=Ilyonectria robusta TaxID=1079257 RepID=UPI001E8CD514|nr:uncharacterized protein BGZ61DRAFT_507586 [Ilyonectria robusta]KAH8684043.1 hypothetical protein BGZ61DRAFT_507586 [Ilyonectria robusta]